MKENMFYGAGNLIFEKARELRNTMTPAEELLWKQIHINEWKIKFRRQHPIANYVVDFYCHEKRLVIELDGGIHNVEEVKKYDKSREEHLKELGLTVLRFRNEQVFNENKLVLEAITNVIRGIASSHLGDGGRKKGKETASSPLGDRGENKGSNKARLYVIKIGGNVIDDERNLHSFLKEFAETFGESAIPPFRGRGLLVHGGGKIATAIGDKLGIQSKYIDGRRITDDDTIDLVTMVYGGLINKKIVADLQGLKCNAIGLCGADGNSIEAVKRPVKTIDYGWTGDIDSSKIDKKIWQVLIDNDLVPVVASLTHDREGHILNTNADTIASSLAVALSNLYEVHLIFCFEKDGVLTDVSDAGSVVTEMNADIYQSLKESKKLFAGILPKIDNAFDAINKGVKDVVIGNSEKLSQLINNRSGTKII